MVDKVDATQEKEWEKVVKKAKRQSTCPMISTRDYFANECVLDSERMVKVFVKI